MAFVICTVLPIFLKSKQKDANVDTHRLNLRIMFLFSVIVN